jgi:hypothetical protein
MPNLTDSYAYTLFQVGFSKPKQFATVSARTAEEAVSKAERVYWREGKAKSVELIDDKRTLDLYHGPLWASITH